MPRSPPLSTSLPSGFRFGGLPSPLLRTPTFYASARDQSEAPAPAVDEARAKTRLEILQGWEVNFAVLCLYAASTLALIYVLIKMDTVAVGWNRDGTIPSLSVAEDIFRLLLQAASFVLPLFFVANLVLHGAVTDEQIWTCVLLAVGLLATNPLTGVVLPVARTPPPVIGTRVLKLATDASAGPGNPELIWNDAVYTAVIYLYLLLAAHSYRVFDVRYIHTLAFYAPKLMIAFGYFLVKVVAGYKADVSLGFVPYARVLTWFFLEQSGRSSLRITVPVLVTTVLDTAIGFWLVREVAVTADFLATVSYVEHRAKQLGFRCFVYQTLAFCFNMIGLSMLITYMLPRTLIYSAYDDPGRHFFWLEPPVARLALAFVYFTWTLVLAYVNLPPRPLIPFVQDVINRCLFLVRNSRVAVWLGLADIVSTEDAEDSSDDDEIAETLPTESQRSLGTHQQVLQAKPSIPFRYCHRELFDDDVVLSPQHVDPISPLVLNDVSPHHNSLDENLSYADFSLGDNERGASRALQNSRPPFEPYRKEISPEAATMLAPAPARMQPSSGANIASQASAINITGTPSFLIDMPSPSGVSHGGNVASDRIYSPSVDSCGPIMHKRKLRIRKNLFVMETQVMMANAAYLSYIPGNPKEERVKLAPRTPKLTPFLHTGSLANDLDDLARQIEEENEALYSKRVSQASPLDEDPPQPDHDDGSMFLVDPYEMAERYGYRIYRHIANEELNTHATVLINSSRVTVAFSGTRDVTNWGVNANIKRVVLDDKLSRFEYEISSCSESGPADHSYADDENFDPFEVPLQSRRFGRSTTNHQEGGRLRRSMSEVRLSIGEPLGSLDSGSPIVSGGADVPSYGTLGGGKKRFGQRGASASGHGGPLGFATQQGVTMVASTFARELMTFGKPKVHEGFINAYMSLRKQVMGTLVELYRGRTGEEDDTPGAQAEGKPGIAESLPLFFCGHSLGGAIARYFKRIGLRRRHDISCTTFGCPRLGNEAFKARYERLVETHWRFEIASDPIPKVPIVLLNYVHVGVQVLMDQSAMLLIDPSFIEVQWWGLLGNWYLGYRLHIRASYCMALRTYCKLYKNGTEDLSECFWPFPIRFQTKGLFHHAHR